MKKIRRFFWLTVNAADDLRPAIVILYALAFVAAVELRFYPTLTGNIVMAMVLCGATFLLLAIAIAAMTYFNPDSEDEDRTNQNPHA